MASLLRFGHCGLKDEEKVVEVEPQSRVGFELILGNVPAAADGLGLMFLKSDVDFDFEEATETGLLLTGRAGIDTSIGLANVPLAGLLTGKDISAGLGWTRTRRPFRGLPRIFGRFSPFASFSLRLYARFGFFISDSSSLEKISSSSSPSKISGVFEADVVGIGSLDDLEDDAAK